MGPLVHGAGQARAPRPRAFTLIELLVVIAIIALLIAILMPALKGARRVARLTQSMSNLKNIAVAFDSYRTDWKGVIPEFSPPGKVPATWSFIGKDADVWWQNNFSGYYDFPARTRPLNPYIAPSVSYEPTVTAANRGRQEFPVCKSPGDRGTNQRTFPTMNYSITSYDDVGTSYHYNGRWYDVLPNTTAANWSAYSMRLSVAFGKLVDSAGVDVSKFVVLHDQTADQVANDNLARNWMGEFGDINKSVMSFLDAHVDYLWVKPYALQGPGYTFSYPLLTRIPTWITP